MISSKTQEEGLTINLSLVLLNTSHQRYHEIVLLAERVLLFGVLAFIHCHLHIYDLTERFFPTDQSIFKRLTGEQSSNFSFQWNSAPNSVGK